MLNKSEKIELVIRGLGIVGCLVFGVACLARSQYYQGRIDARDEMTKQIEELKVELIKNNKIEK